MTTLVESPENRKLLADKIEAFNKHQTIKDAAADAQNNIKTDIKEALGITSGEFSRRAKIRRLSQEEPTKYEEMREVDECIHEENDILFKGYKSVPTLEEVQEKIKA